MAFNIGTETNLLVDWKTLLDDEEYDIPHPEKLAVPSSLSFQKLPMPSYAKLLMCKKHPELIDKSRPTLCGAQIEAALLILSKFTGPLVNETQPGFLLGDQTGCGKTRVAALCLAELAVQDIPLRKALWVSIGIDLKKNLQDELKTLRADLSIRRLSKGRDLRKKDGVLFVTYSQLRGMSYKSLFAAVDWLGDNFSGLIVLDESHVCREQKTMTARAIKWLQNHFPLAKILYMTATAGTEARHLHYAARLQLWGVGCPFKDPNHFEENIRNWGINSMEVISNHLQSNGNFLARQLNVPGIQKRPFLVQLSALEKNIYDQCTKLWQAIYEYIRDEYFGKKEYQAKRQEYWGKHQRFFEALILTFKASAVSQIRERYPEDRYSLVISLQTTGDQAYQSFKAKNSEEFSLCREIIRLAFNRFGIDIIKNTNPWGAVAITTFAVLSPHFGRNPIDQIIEDLGGHENVVEITGRLSYQERLDSDRNDGFAFVNKLLPKDKNGEIEKFQTGMKKNAVISLKGATGISLHADKKFPGVLQRVQVVFQIPWVAEQGVQQLGRVNRANQAFPPIYEVMSTDVPAEHRFTQSFLNRSASLGAMCCGQRNSQGTIEDNVNNPFSEAPHLVNEASTCLMEDVHNDKCSPNLKTQLDNVELSMEATKGKAVSINLFLNRALGVELQFQSTLLSMLQERFRIIVKGFKDKGQLEPQMKELSEKWRLNISGAKTVFGNDPNLSTTLLKIKADRGVSFKKLEVAINVLRRDYKKEPLFFCKEKEINCCFINTISKPCSGMEGSVQSYNIFTPWQCEFPQVHAHQYLRWDTLDYNKDKALIEAKWTDMYKLGTIDSCLHTLRGEKLKCNDEYCRVESAGSRKFSMFILTGCLLYCWETLRSVFHGRRSEQRALMQILRLRVSDKLTTDKYIGLYCPSRLVNTISCELNAMYDREASAKPVPHNPKNDPDIQDIQKSWNDRNKKYKEPTEIMQGTLQDDEFAEQAVEMEEALYEDDDEDPSDEDDSEGDDEGVSDEDDHEEEATTATVAEVTKKRKRSDSSLKDVHSYDLVLSEDSSDGA